VFYLLNSHYLLDNSLSVAASVAFRIRFPYIIYVN